MIFYYIPISIVAIVITIYDKYAAINKFRRIPEKTLYTFAALGGALAMFITMQIIRHKTKHMDFMIVLPILSVIHTVVAVFLL